MGNRAALHITKLVSCHATMFIYSYVSQPFFSIGSFGQIKNVWGTPTISKQTFTINNYIKRTNLLVKSTKVEASTIMWLFWCRIIINIININRLATTSMETMYQRKIVYEKLGLCKFAYIISLIIQIFLNFFWRVPHM